uniref:Uncharacterized protein n=1 Tax=Anopheles albimanus TaxID=7167 RepID=A0A182FZE4_ANOAL
MQLKFLLNRTCCSYPLSVAKQAAPETLMSFQCRPIPGMSGGERKQETCNRVLTDDAVKHSSRPEHRGDGGIVVII